MNNQNKELTVQQVQNYIRAVKRMAKQLDCYPSKNPEGETIRVYPLYK
jgi:hypothetical protein